jgi:4-amino-4-deoxy-L-arabinose transferase-like glycosyltransferase
MNSKKEIIILFFLVLIGSILRLYNLSWGNGYFFHPDEGNMARAVSQFSISLPITDYRLPITFSLNPHFFAYGQFPLYLAYFSGILIKISSFVSQLLITDYRLPIVVNALLTLSFSESVYFLRFISALFSIALIPLIYVLIKKITTSAFALIGTFLIIFVPGLIQSAHFGTTESILTFFLTFTTFLSFLILESNKKRFLYIILSGVVTGISLGTKLTGIFTAVPVLLLLLILTHPIRKNWKRRFVELLCFFSTVFVFFLVSSPYNALEFRDFLGALSYEQGVATGALQVFYTRQFIHTLSVLFQILHIFPYSLGIALLISAILGIGLSIQFVLNRYSNNKKKTQKHQHVILLGTLAIYFISNSFIFAKWTRFMTPLLPILVVFTSYFFFKFSELIKTKSVRNSKKMHAVLKIAYYCLLILVLLTTTISGLKTLSVYIFEDTRIQASRWIYRNIPDNSYILSETGNVVDIPIVITDNRQPITDNRYTVISFDFYHLDEDLKLKQELINHLEEADYIFIPSRRIFANHMRLPDQFPLLNNYYKALFTGELGFEEVVVIAPSPISQFPNFPISNSDESAEETWSVFDHPTIRIYKKTKQLSSDSYLSILSK